LARERPYDLVVVDTAPTGHTLRLLSAPDVVAAVAEALDALHEHHRIVRTQLARVGRVEAGDRLVAALADQARETGERLRDATRSTFRWVLLAEELSLAESEDGLAALRGCPGVAGTARQRRRGRRCRAGDDPGRRAPDPVRRQGRRWKDDLRCGHSRPPGAGQCEYAGAAPVDRSGPVAGRCVRRSDR